MQHHLNAAKGWLGLRNYSEANRELELIAGPARVHPDVLELRWQIYSQQKMWTAALEIATAIVELAPERAFGWIHQAYSLHALGRTAQAYERLSRVADRFMELPVIPYSLACYGCQIGKLDDAFSWMQKAMECGDSKRIVHAALAEITLEPIWDRLRKATGKRKSVVYLPNASPVAGKRARYRPMRLSKARR